MQLLVFFCIPYQHVQKIIILARHQIAGEDLWMGSDRVFKAFKVLSVLTLERNLHKYRLCPADHSGIKKRHIFPYRA